MDNRKSPFFLFFSWVETFLQFGRKISIIFLVLEMMGEYNINAEERYLGFSNPAEFYVV